jgi:hypothetical protein
MPSPINIEQIARDNPNLNIAKIVKSCEFRKSRKIEGRGYNLAPPSERRRAIIGRKPGDDPRTIRLRASLYASNATNSSNSQT